MLRLASIKCGISKPLCYPTVGINCFSWFLAYGMPNKSYKENQNDWIVIWVICRSNWKIEAAKYVKNHLCKITLLCYNKGYKIWLEKRLSKRPFFISYFCSMFLTTKTFVIIIMFREENLKCYQESFIKFHFPILCRESMAKWNVLLTKQISLSGCLWFVGCWWCVCCGFLLTKLWHHGFRGLPYLSDRVIFSACPGSLDRDLDIVGAKRAFGVKWKAFFIIFEGLSLKQIKKFFLEGESPTLISLLMCIYVYVYVYSLTKFNVSLMDSL